ncbi:MAG: response regulator transcription factor [Chloroflexi bacterium]|nr:response regulator transcription factor [Chloroflexota bacterium]
MKVLIIDDDPEIQETLTIALNIRWPDAQIVSANTGKAGVDVIRKESPDLVFLDIGLPDMDGFATCRAIRAVSNIPIVMLTAKTSAFDKAKALELGADDYITKPFNHIELLARARSVMRRYQNQSERSRVLETGGIVIDFAAHKVIKDGTPVHLTPREFSLLWQMANKEGEVCEARSLMSSVWGNTYVDAAGYILKNHIRKLRNKIEDDPDNPRYILNERGVGYKFLGHGV